VRFSSVSSYPLSPLPMAERGIKLFFSLLSADVEKNQVDVPLGKPRSLYSTKALVEMGSTPFPFYGSFPFSLLLKLLFFPFHFTRQKELEFFSPPSCRKCTKFLGGGVVRITFPFSLPPFLLRRVRELASPPPPPSQTTAEAERPDLFFLFFFLSYKEPSTFFLGSSVIERFFFSFPPVCRPSLFFFCAEEGDFCDPPPGPFSVYFFD